MELIVALIEIETLRALSASAARRDSKSRAALVCCSRRRSSYSCEKGLGIRRIPLHWHSKRARNYSCAREKMVDGDEGHSRERVVNDVCRKKIPQREKCSAF